MVAGRRGEWVGCFVSVTILLVYAMSGKYGGRIVLSSDTDRGVWKEIGLAGGELWLHEETRTDGTDDVLRFDLVSSKLERFRLNWGWDWGSFMSGSYRVRYVFLPLWLPLLLIAAPTAYLWRTARRPMPWQRAPCRRDLRALGAGR